MSTDSSREGRSGQRRFSAERAVEMASDRYGLVLVLLLITFILASALPNTGWSQALLVVTAAITVLATLAASGTSRRHRRVATLLAIAAVLVSLIGAAVGGRTAGVPGVITSVLLFVCLLAIINRISRHTHVSSQTLLGATCCYVLFGLVYTFVYAAIARVEGSSILDPGNQHSLSDYLFFSYTTLTTTGYGDLVPANGLGRALAMLEALMGQLFLVTVVARLVALWAPRRAQRSRDQ
jgi:Ion channel